MKKIGIFLNVDPSGGGTFQYAQSVVEALNSLDQNLYQVKVAYGNPEWIKVLSKHDFKKIHLKNAYLGKFISDLFMAFLIPGVICRLLSRFLNPLVKELIKIDCDLWIFPGQESISYQVPGKVISTIHDLMHKYEPEFPEVNSKFRYFIRENRYKNIIKNSTVVLVDSVIGKKQVIESYNPKKMNIIIMPFIAPKYIHNENERNDFDKVYILPDKFIFYPAQFWLHKNHYNLLDAIKIVKEDFSDIFLVLSGGKNHLYDEIYRYADNLGIQRNILFAGYIPDEDFRGFYLRARALIMPSFFGPTNIPPLEAMATGCPSAISNVYAMKEQSGDAAIYFNPNSSSEIADQIIKLWNNDDLCAEISKNGLKKSKLNNQEHFNERLTRILDSCFI